MHRTFHQMDMSKWAFSTITRREHRIGLGSSLEQKARQVRTSSGGGQQRSVSFAGATPIYAIM